MFITKTSPVVKIAHVLCLPGGKSSLHDCVGSLHMFMLICQNFTPGLRERLDSKPKIQKLIGKIKIGKSIPQLKTPDCWPVICHFYNHLTRLDLDLAQFAGQLGNKKIQEIFNQWLNLGWI